MLSSSVRRWSGLAALVGGGLFAILGIAESLLWASKPYSEAAATGAWITVQGGYTVAGVLANLGLVGLYVLRGRKVGTLGLLAFLVAFVGGMMATGATWSEAIFGSWLASAAPQLLNADPAGIVLVGALFSLLLFALGWFLVGLASLRASLLPQGAAIFLMIGALLFVVVGALELPFSTVPLGAALAWVGLGLWFRPIDEPGFIGEAAT